MLLVQLLVHHLVVDICVCICDAVGTVCASKGQLQWRIQVTGDGHAAERPRQQALGGWPLPAETTAGQCAVNSQSLRVIYVMLFTFLHFVGHFPDVGIHCSLSMLCIFVPRVGPGYPLSAFAPPLSIHFLIFCSLLPFSFSHSLYLFSSIVHPIPFYQNSPTPFPGVRS